MCWALCLLLNRQPSGLLLTRAFERCAKQTIDETIAEYNALCARMAPQTFE